MVLAASAMVVGCMAAPSALAQSNPFEPPQRGMSRAQIEQIVRQEVERAARTQAGRPGATGATSTTPGTPARPGGTPAAGDVRSQMRNAPAQPGSPPSTPGSAPAAAGAAGAAPDPVADLLKDGGVFVGCVSGTPIFKDKIGRRAYFTTKELRESHEARRFTRCG